MKIIINILTIALFIVACNNKTHIKNENLQQAQSFDTAINAFISNDQNVVVRTKDTILLIDNKNLKLTYTAKVNSSIPFLCTEIYTEKGKKINKKYQGFNSTYAFTLTDQFNKKVFSTTLNKNDFQDLISCEILSQSDAILPHFIGYLSKFDAFVFTVDFAIPSSDVGHQCFFMLNRNGNLIKNSFNNYFADARCDGEIEIPTNEEFILTCREIIHYNSKVIEINDQKHWQVAVKLINDNTILVIQEYNETSNIKNARLIDKFGKTLAQFSYKGYYEALGYRVPMFFDTTKQNYFLLDEKQKNIRYIHQFDPKSSFTVKFDEMRTFNNDIKENEIKFLLQAEYQNYQFALDTLTNTLRLQIDE